MNQINYWVFLMAINSMMTLFSGCSRRQERLRLFLQFTGHTSRTFNINRISKKNKLHDCS
jgi:hypothetical protein